MRIGTAIDKFHTVRERKRALEATIAELKRELQELNDQVIVLLDKEDITASRGRKATASISEVIVPSVEDWDDFYRFIHRRKYYHLLERRPSVTGCRELFETKGKIPGVVPFKKRKLNVNSL